MRIEDYAIIADTQTVALVSNRGSIDWLCLPRFDSGACFAALLGDHRHGSWQLHPEGEIRSTSRRYRGDTMILETELTTDDGTVRIVDAMPLRTDHADLVRIVEGVSGRVPMRMDLTIRFDYGMSVPWVRRIDGDLCAVAGPDALCLRSPIHTHGVDLSTTASFTVGPGDRVPFSLTWFRSYEPVPPALDPFEEMAATEAWWTEWAARSTYQGEWRDAVMRSLLTLKALTYAPTGGIVAAATTSLPEQLGGVRNWDYRYCWLRDATFTLYALMTAGYDTEAAQWRDWLLRAVAGSPEDLQIMYGVAGERRLEEQILDWLPGYEGSTPVRIGNLAAKQFQLDVYGEVMDALHNARRVGVPPDDASWQLQKSLMDFLEGHWREPDEGIWEVRGPRRHFTHSKVMAWVAADRAVRAVEQFGREGPCDGWKVLREEIKAEVLDRGWDPHRRTFTQYYGSRELDASLLMIPLVGFLPATDERMVATVDAIERELGDDGLIRRYSQPDASVDGLPPGEGSFLACTFWLADNLAMQGRRDEAVAHFERLLSLRNDVGLLAEEYDVAAGRQLGNFPQAFSHVPLVNTARNLSLAEGGPARSRCAEDERTTDPS